jgi:hypothetical protein
MCLDLVYNQVICPSKKVEATAYKVFRKNDDGSLQPEFGYGDRRRYLNNVWYKRKIPAAWCGGRWGCPKYPAGFHAYKTLQGAQAHAQGCGVVVEIKLRMIRTVGAQDQATSPDHDRNYTCFVADEMKITKIIKEY